MLERLEREVRETSAMRLYLTWRGRPIVRTVRGFHFVTGLDFEARLAHVDAQPVIVGLAYSGGSNHRDRHDLTIVVADCVIFGYNRALRVPRRRSRPGS
jgi:hypothetical protein